MCQKDGEKRWLAYSGKTKISDILKAGVAPIVKCRIKFKNEKTEMLEGN